MGEGRETVDLDTKAWGAADDQRVWRKVLQSQERMRHQYAIAGTFR